MKSTFPGIALKGKKNETKQAARDVYETKKVYQKPNKPNKPNKDDYFKNFTFLHLIIFLFLLTLLIIIFNHCQVIEQIKIIELKQSLK
jgi:hypothetical protein